MRVLITGMGGELGTRLAQLLEEHPEVTDIAGVDFVPPRRRLRRSEFRRIDPRDREKLVAFVHDVAPSAVVHYGVYEPDSRVGPRDAAAMTTGCTVAALGAAARAGNLDRIVLRSGLEVYGRGPSQALVPDEGAPPEPTSAYGRMCLDTETMGAVLGRRHDFPVAAMRLATVAGSHVPSPLGRVLRLPVVPVPTFADPAFSLLGQEDAARAMVSALLEAYDGPLNVVGSGATTPLQAARLGGRIPVPIAGPAWRLARRAAELAGAPIPPHVLELLRAGRAGDGTHAVRELGLGRLVATTAICAELYEWATVTPIRPVTEEVA